MRNRALILVIFFIGVTFAQNPLNKNELPKLEITANEYQQLKEDGKLNPHINYQIIMSSVPHVRKNDKPITPIPTGGAKSAGNCACYIPPDATWTLAMAPNDDGSTGTLSLPFNFCLYGTNYTDFWINNNGNVTFDAAYGTFSAVGFPDPSYVMVAPFWGDVDTRGAGEVWYKITPTALYVDWVGVGYFNTQTDKLNTFSLIITDGSDPIIGVGNNVAFCYGDMQWTTGSASGGVGGFGGVPATVGANKGDGISYVQYGRFDQPGTAYDGPVGANDGVSWLDDQSLIFNACNTTNISPTLSADVPICDTIDICLGNTVTDTINVLSPEIGQFTEVSATSLSPQFSVVSITNGNIAQLIYTINGTTTGLFDVQVTAFDDGVPADTVTFNLVFNIIPNTIPQPSITATDTIICPGENTTLAISNIYDEILWSNNDADSSTVVNMGGMYYVTATLNGCSKQDSITIAAFPNPIPVLNSVSQICSGQNDTLSVINGPFSSYTWSGAGSGTNSSLVISNTGTYSVTVTDENGCSGGASVTISIFTPPTASIGLYPLCITRYSVDNLSSPINNITNSTWYMGDGTIFANVDTSTFNYIWDNSGTFIVSLVVTDNNGCTDSISQNLVIPDTIDITIPNILIHSSTSGNNQFDFNLLSTDFNLCVEYDFHIYDRWGVEVFEVHNDPQNPDFGCTKCFKGESKTKTTLTQGTYFYVLKGAYSLEKRGFIEIFD